MKSDPPPDSASFDALWDSLEDGTDLPPALGGKGAPKAEPAEEPPSGGERATVAPPGPPGEYVQKAMALGELDDPGLIGGPPQAPDAKTRPDIPAVPIPPGRAKALGLVLAAENELLLDQELDRPKPRAPLEPFAHPPELSKPPRPREPPRPVAVVPAPGPRKRSSSAKFPAVQVGGGPPRPAMAVGARGAAAPAHVLPVPRAPSVPPEVDTGPEVEVAAFDAEVALDGLGSLDSLDDFDLGSLPIAGDRPAPAEVPPSEPRRFTPAVLSAPTSSKPVPSASPRPVVTRPTPAPVAVGLRLGKRPAPAPAAPPAETISDRITPVGEQPSWISGAVVTAPASSGAPISSGPQSSGRFGAEAAPISDAAPSSLPDRAREMQVLFEAKNYSSALVLAESVLLSDPAHAQAKRCAEGCREALTEKYLGNLGGRANVPQVTMGPEEMRWLSLDHRAGFLLSFIDGSMSIDEVLDVSSMPELDALRIMFELRMQGVIEIVEPRRPGRR